MSSRRLSTVLVDQVVASGCSYVAVLLVARSASPSVLGAFLVGFGVLAFATAVGRAAFGVVLGMDVADHGDEHSRNDVVRRSATAAAVLGAGAGVALGVVGLVAGGRLGVLLVVLGVAAPLVTVLDVLRFRAVAEARPDRALTADLVWLVPCLGVVGVDLVRGDALAAEPAMLVWLGALLAGLLALARTERLRLAPLAGTWTWARGDARRGHLAVDASVSALTPVANGFGAALADGAAATAAVRGSAALFAPLATLTSAMALGAVPEAHRREPAAARALLLRLTGLLLLAALAWSAIALVLPDAVGVELLGESWPAARDLLPLVSIEYAGLALWSGGTALLRYSGSTRTALTIRMVYAPAAVVLPPVALLLTGDVRAFAGTLAALGVALGVGGLAVGLRRASPRD